MKSAATVLDGRLAEMNSANVGVYAFILVHDACHHADIRTRRSTLVFGIFYVLRIGCHGSLRTCEKSLKYGGIYDFIVRLSFKLTPYPEIQQILSCLVLYSNAKDDF